MTLSDQIKAAQLDLAVLKLIAESSAPDMLQQLMSTMSLRQIARRLDRSPTYLSHVKSGTCNISLETFMLLEQLYIESELSK